MNETEARDLLRRAADGIPLGQPATTALVHHGRQKLRRRRRAEVLAVLAALSALIVGGYQLTSPGSNARPPVAATPAPRPTAVTAGSTVVPVLQDLSRTAAMRRLRDFGLRAAVTTTPSRCVPPGSVLSQQPRVGTEVPKGSLVSLVLAAKPPGTPDCPAGVATAHDRVIASGFYEFAQSAGRDPAPLAPGVSLGLGADVIRWVKGDDIVDPQSWRLPGPFAGSAGPFSALDVVAGSNGSYRLSVGPHARCAGPPIDPPPALRSLRQLSIQPRSPDSCLQWWSVDLFINDVGQIQAATLDLWEP